MHSCKSGISNESTARQTSETFRLLQMTSPSLSPVRFTLILIAIESATVRSELSPALQARAPNILDRVFAALQQTRRASGASRGRRSAEARGGWS